MKHRQLPNPGIVLLACMLSGCAATATPAQQALESRRIFNTALETIHTLHGSGQISAEQERQLLPAINAASAALDQMDADALAGNSAGFDVAAAAMNAAVSQLNAAIIQSQQTTRPATAPSTRPSAIHGD
jgi:hypothetical protein